MDRTHLIAELRRAIKGRHHISLRYLNSNAKGLRRGCPYALHVTRRTGDEAMLMYLELRQISGDSSNPLELPAIRRLVVEHIELIEVHAETLFPVPNLDLSRFGIIIEKAE